MTTRELPGLRDILALLREHVPAGEWWPAEDDFEVIVGAILTQNTAWTNVEKALSQMRENGLLEPDAVMCCDQAELALAIKSRGYMKIKAGYLRGITRWYLDNCDLAHAKADNELRESLLSVRGVGPETADDILLYVFERPVFIWDLYARRLLNAVGYQVPERYEAARKELGHLLQLADLDVAECKELHGLIVDGGKIAKQNGGDYWYCLGQLPIDTLVSDGSP